jgi:hypothetical protein
MPRARKYDGVFTGGLARKSDGFAIGIARVPTQADTLTSVPLCTEVIRAQFVHTVREKRSVRAEAIFLSLLQSRRKWWTWPGSNRRRPACKTRNSPPTIPLEAFKH